VVEVDHGGSVILANPNDRTHDVDGGLDERESIVRVVNVARSIKQVDEAGR